MATDNGLPPTDAEMASLTEPLERNKKSGCITRNRSRRMKACCIDNMQVFLILTGVAGGIILGVILRDVGPFKEPHKHPREMMYLKFPGEITFRMLKLIALPLVASSLISGIASLDAKSSGKIGLRTMCFYLCTTFLAVTEGLIWIYAVRPGSNVRLPSMDGEESKLDYNSKDAVLDMIRNLFPDNIVAMCFQMVQTESKMEEVLLKNNSTNITTMLKEKITLQKVDSFNMLGLTVVSIVFAITLTTVGQKAKIIVQIFEVIFEITMKIVMKVLWIYPFGIASWLAAMIIQMEDPVQQLIAMAKFLGMSLAALATHTVIVMPLVLWVFTRRNPFKYMLGVLKAMVTAFAAASSAVTLPVTMKCLETKNRMNPYIIRFMCPIGASVNMDGTALYEAMAVIFIAMLRGMDTGFATIVTVAFTTVAVSIGVAPTVGGPMVIYLLLFQSIGIPIEDIGLLIPFDWFLSRVRTMINVWGDCVGVAVVQKFSSKELDKISRRNDVESKGIVMNGDMEATHQV